MHDILGALKKLVPGKGHIRKTLRRVNNLLLRARVSAVAEVAAIFDTDTFLTKTRQLPDPFVREHALNVIERGFTVVPNAVPSDLIDAAEQSFLQWKERNRSKFLPEFYKHDDKLTRVVNIHMALPAFQRLFTLNRALAVQDYLFQGETALYTSLFFEVGSTQDVHRDIPLFWTKPANMYFGTWTALEKSDATNGPLIVLPGSQRLPLLDRDSIAREKYSDLSKIEAMDDNLWSSYQKRITQMCKDRGLVAEEVHIQRGDTIIWHPLLVHGGAKILDWTRTRKSLVVHTTPRGVPVFHNDVFFNVRRRVSNKAPWANREVDGRCIAQMGSLVIGHSSPCYDFAQLQ